MLSRHSFLKTYLINFNAFEAAKAMGHKFYEVPEAYYVYFLVHPVSGKIFYVGKGKGDRRNAHLKDFYNSRIDNYKKHFAIYRILKEGQKPVAIIYENSLSEEEAYALEAFFITNLMEYNITNLVPGNSLSREDSIEQCKNLLATIIPFKKWCNMKDRSKEDKKYYRLVKKGVQQLCVTGNIVKVILNPSQEGIKISYEYR